MIEARCETSDRELVDAVRQQDDAAFEELYRRYRPRIAAFVRGMLRDEARSEDVTQDAFLSALRRMRATDAEIAFKPWIYEIARNAAIDSWRRASRAEEVSMDAEETLRPADRLRLTGGGAPESQLIVKERLGHLCGAFEELPDVQTRVLVLRELEGLSYREIGERLELTRPAVESALFRARRRLETEYAELSEGRRCVAIRATIARLAEGVAEPGSQLRLARHARRCHACRRWARELGVEPLSRLRAAKERLAALLPVPFFLRRSGGSTGGGGGGLWGHLPAGGQAGAALSERAAALLAAAAIAGAGGVALSGGPVLGGERDGTPAGPPAAAKRGAAVSSAADPATAPKRGGERAASAPGQRAGGGERAAEPGSESAASPPPAGPGEESADDAAPAAPGVLDTGGVTEPVLGETEVGVDAPALPDAESVPELPVPDLPELSPPVTAPEVGPLPDVGGTVQSVTETIDGALP